MHSTSELPGQAHALDCEQQHACRWCTQAHCRSTLVLTGCSPISSPPQYIGHAGVCRVWSSPYFLSAVWQLWKPPGTKLPNRHQAATHCGYCQLLSMVLRTSLRQHRHTTSTTYHHHISHSPDVGACRFLYSHPVPVVVGPGGRHYLIDHHHLARAMHEKGITTCYAGEAGLCGIGPPLAPSFQLQKPVHALLAYLLALCCRLGRSPEHGWGAWRARAF
jgi:hypothetical protein